MRLRSGPDDGTVRLEQVLEVLRRQGVTVLTVVGSDIVRMRKGRTLISQSFPPRLPNAMLRRLAADFDFDWLRFHRDVIEEDLDPSC